ncbi:DDE-type integrase/transposase/recombinase [Leptothrix ochracea]|uniref:DDE-type integrase/transposase/recombinase n=1 Tax=Leptothrix ochracea TaxID=735331 RepID=UPI0034E1C5FE
MKQIDKTALFRLSVIGQLVSREQLQRGELQQIIRELAQRNYAIPGSRRTQLGEKTIQAWYYNWLKGGIEALVPQTRTDRGLSKLVPEVQEAILNAKRENPRRSIRQIQLLLETSGVVADNVLSRSSIHRLLQTHGISRMTGSASLLEEKRSFSAEFAGSVWYGDVLHGPAVPTPKGMRKAYLVSLMDDASRLIAHSAFCLGETALDIEGVLKQAVLKRGLPKKLIVDNGAAYRSATLQGICARLGIHLIYCRPYAPEGKGKLERWHRTFRDQFLSELDASRVLDLSDLNARLWAWVERIYHLAPHSGLGGLTPLARYQKDLVKIRTLGQRATHIDAIFLHRVSRFVRKDGTVSYEGNFFEVPYELAGQTVQLVVDPHAGTVAGVENQAGESLGLATMLDAVGNMQRVRRKPQTADADAIYTPRIGPNMIETALVKYHGKKGA